MTITILTMRVCVCLLRDFHCIHAFLMELEKLTGQMAIMYYRIYIFFIPWMLALIVCNRCNKRTFALSNNRNVHDLIWPYSISFGSKCHYYRIKDDATQWKVFFSVVFFSVVFFRRGMFLTIKCHRIIVECATDK